MWFCRHQEGLEQQYIAAVYHSGHAAAELLHGLAGGSRNSVFAHKYPFIDFYRPL